MMSLIVKILVFIITVQALDKKVVDKILELKLYQICIFKSTENFIQYNLISEKIPTIIINPNDTKLFNDSRSLENIRNALKNSDLHITVEREDNFDTHKIINSLNLLVELNPGPPRSKYLVILIANTKSTNVNFKSLFRAAWSLKFLDFSILTLHNLDSKILTYNPFFNTHNRNNLSSASLFPDKLNNMNGFKLRTLLFNRPPHIELINSTINGFNYGFLKTTSQALNFQFQYVDINKTHNIADGTILSKIESGDIDVSSITHLLGVQLKDVHRSNSSMLASRVVRGAKMTLTGPILHIHNPRSRINLKIVAYSVLTASLILTIMVLLKTCKLSSNIWTPIYVFALLFGITVFKRPRKPLDKCIFAVLAVLSIQYSSEIFAVFTDNEVMSNDEIVYDALKEIQQPSLPIYYHKTYFQGELHHVDQVIRYLKAHSVSIDSLDECFRELSRFKNRFCFSTSIFAKHKIHKYGATSMKILDPLVHRDFFVFVYAKASPYVRKFDQKYLRVYESGIAESMHHGRRYLEIYRRLKDAKFEAVKSVWMPLVIFMAGCFFSAASFVFEFVYFWVCVRPGL